MKSNKESAKKQKRKILQNNGQKPTEEDWKRIENEDKIFVAIGLSFMALAYEMRNLISVNSQGNLKYLYNIWESFCFLLIFVFLYTILLRFYAIILDDIQIRWMSIRQLAFSISLALLLNFWGIFASFFFDFLDKLSLDRWIKESVHISLSALFVVFILFFQFRIFRKRISSFYQKSRYYRILESDQF